MKVVTAPGSAAAPPFRFIEPDLSNTSDITSGLRCAVALTVTSVVSQLPVACTASNARRKVLFTVAVAVTLTQVLPDMHGGLVNQVTVGVTAVPRPGTD